MAMEIHSVGSTGEELADRLERLAKLLRGGKADMDECLLGLERKPHERVDNVDRGRGDVERDKGPKSPYRWRAARPGESSEGILLTLRRDLLAVRRRLLGGAGRKSVLFDLDYTIDQLDNALGEM